MQVEKRGMDLLLCAQRERGSVKSMGRGNGMMSLLYLSSRRGPNRYESNDDFERPVRKVRKGGVWWGCMSRWIDFSSLAPVARRMQAFALGLLRRRVLGECRERWVGPD
jgi:hypothetical protein